MPEAALIQALRSERPICWSNPALAAATVVLPTLPLGWSDIADAAARLDRWAPALGRLFPELGPSGGIIESPIARLADPLTVLGLDPPGAVWLKQDHALPVAGTVKARGGLYEVLVIAERILRDEGLDWSEPLMPLRPDARKALSRYAVAVGSTGNLGLAVGIMAAALGLQATVHMASIARGWKKAMLRAHGVAVVEHDGDFSAAVAAGREAARLAARQVFVDDERSEHLFLGYAVAAIRLRQQLLAAGITIGSDRPLCVYLPCGVGGAPGGITFGLKHVFGDAVHCWFAEPCASPAMLVRLAFGGEFASVHDLGLSNRTEADGLAVSQASELVHGLTHRLISGVFTVDDDALSRSVHRLQASQGIAIEPSAAAGFGGPRWLHGRTPGADPSRVVHLLWTTGGRFVPPDEHQRHRLRGAALDAVQGDQAPGQSSTRPLNPP